MNCDVDWAAFFSGATGFALAIGKWVVPAVLSAYVLGKLLDALKAKWSR